MNTEKNENSLEEVVERVETVETDNAKGRDKEVAKDQSLTKSNSLRVVDSKGLKMDYPSLDYTLKNPEVQLRGDSLVNLYKDKDSGKTKFAEIGKSIVLESISKNIETGEIKYDLNINTFDNRVISVDGLNRLATRDASEMLKLSAFGADVNGRNAKFYISSLENQERFIELKNFHEKLGWGTYNGKDIFKHSKAIGVESDYKGELAINKCGSLEGRINFLQGEVIGYIPLELAIAIGLSAVVVGYIGELISVNSQVVQIYGQSSIGKTTVGELIISISTRPTLANNGLMYSWNATANSIIANLRNNKGHPVLFDDTSVSRINNMDTMIYQLVQGRDKDRMNKDGSLRESDTWATTIISTGEQSLLGNSNNKNDGIRVRLIEFPDIKWTKDAEHSMRIKRAVQEDYGHEVEIVAKCLLELGKEKTLEKIEEIKISGKRYLESEGRENTLYDRLLNSVATIILGITLLEDELKLGFNIKEISELVLDHILIDDRAIEQQAFDDLISYVEANINRFNRVTYKLKDLISNTLRVKENLEDNPKERYSKQKLLANTNQQILGKIEDISLKEFPTDITSKEEPKTKGYHKKLVIKREITLPTEEFKKIMKELGYNNPTGILKSWKNQELLDCDKDRHTRKRTITEGGSSIPVYVIRSTIELETKKALKEESIIDVGKFRAVKDIDIDELLDGLLEEDGSKEENKN